MASPFKWKDVFENAKTQTKDASAELIAIAKGSFDTLSHDISKLQNRVVDREAALERFEMIVKEQRDEFTSELDEARRLLDEARRDWDAMVEARGIRGVLTVGVTK